MSNFLTDDQMASLVEAIAAAEKSTTGEIKIHIDSHTEDNTAAKALEVFNAICKGQTREENAVLFHVDFEHKYLTIIGDAGIHKKVHQSFWDSIHDQIVADFAVGNYYDGLRDAVLKTGIELTKYFPATGENPNELSNEITFS